MNQIYYFNMKEDKNKKDINTNFDRILSKEENSKKNSFKNDSFTENKIKAEEYPPIDKASFLKGLSLVFIYFSLIYILFYTC